MEYVEFVKMKERFRTADVSTKIDMYVNAEGLDNKQYRELLTLFPLSELGKLEEALNSC